jgi:hypothetical protein
MMLRFKRKDQRIAIPWSFYPYLCANRSSSLLFKIGRALKPECHPEGAAAPMSNIALKRGA